MSKTTSVLILFVLALVAWFLLAPAQRGMAQVQQPAAHADAPAHFNPIIEKLAKGQPMIGLNTSNLSLSNCHAMARMNYDYVYVDMEHEPMNLTDLGWCIAAMSDKATALQKGSAAPKVALIARFPPYGRDTESNDWIAKQALDMGLMGIIFNGVDNAQEMRRLIQSMRYPQKKDSKYPDPPGLRGFDPANAVFAWGIPNADYERHADVWPLNPEGELVAIPMIETAEGLKNADAIAATPGVAGIFVGAGGDLHQYLGVDSGSPELEAGFQTILAACKAHNVACGISCNNKAQVDMRLAQGWKMIRTVAGVQP